MLINFPIFFQRVDEAKQRDADALENDGIIDRAEAAVKKSKLLKPVSNLNFLQNCLNRS